MAKEFKKGDNVTFVCSEQPTEGTIEESMGNGVYKVNCNGMYVAVVAEHLTPKTVEKVEDTTEVKRGRKPSK